MGKTTSISWTDSTRNFWRGCTKVFEHDPITGIIIFALGACNVCYVERNAKHQGFDFPHIAYTNWKAVEHDLLTWTPRKIFIEDYGDFFHEAVPDKTRDAAWDLLDRVDWTHLAKYGRTHQYQILTKRAKKMEEYFSGRMVPDNIWVGVSIGNKASLYYMNCLKRINAKIKWISFEPLVEDLVDNDKAYREKRFFDPKYIPMYENVFDDEGLVNLEGIQWVVIGGESGSRQTINGIDFPRPMQEEWVAHLMLAARKYNAKVFFKQWGGPLGRDGAGGNMIAGRKIQEFPIEIECLNK